MSDEVVRLGEAYSIATEYTSFIVLENDVEYQRWHIQRRNALRIDRDRNSQQALRDKLSSLRNQATDALGPSPVMPMRLTQLPVADPQVATPSLQTPGFQAPSDRKPTFFPPMASAAAEFSQ